MKRKLNEDFKIEILTKSDVEISNILESILDDYDYDDCEDCDNKKNAEIISFLRDVRFKPYCKGLLNKVLGKPENIQDEVEVQISSITNKTGKITGQDLMDWSIENGEEVLVDGPWCYDEAQEIKLCNKISYAILKKYKVAVKLNDVLEFFEERDSTLVNIDEEKLYMIALDCFAELINEEKIIK